MKKVISLTVLAVFLAGLLFAALDYTTIDPSSLPVYSGLPGDAGILVVFEDAGGQYVLVLVDGYLYVCYLN